MKSKKYTKNLFQLSAISLVFLVSHTTLAQTDSQSEQNRYQKAYNDVYRDDIDDTWVDNGRDTTKHWLNDKASVMNNWFGETDPERPASANLRFLVDYNHNHYDGDTIKPKIRGRLRLPALEKRLSLMIGDDELDDERYNTGMQTNTRGNQNGKIFDRRQARENNASLALRWSKFKDNIDVDTDIDVGVRSTDDVYVRLRAEKIWQNTDDISTRLEQIYRYGIDSKHYLRTNLQVNKHLTASRYLSNHAYLDYRHDTTEELVWGDSLYQHHTFQGTLGDKTLSYGLHVSGEILDKSPNLDTYGPYISYRQPVWRKWLFLQGDLTYYNDKPANRDHNLGTFVRLEAMF